MFQKLEHFLEAQAKRCVSNFIYGFARDSGSSSDTLQSVLRLCFCPTLAVCCCDDDECAFQFHRFKCLRLPTMADPQLNPETFYLISILPDLPKAAHVCRAASNCIS